MPYIDIVLYYCKLLQYYYERVSHSPEANEYYQKEELFVGFLSCYNFLSVLLFGISLFGNKVWRLKSLFPVEYDYSDTARKLVFNSDRKMFKNTVFSANFHNFPREHRITAVFRLSKIRVFLQYDA